jgi:spore coat protein U-like protein
MKTSRHWALPLLLCAAGGTHAQTCTPIDGSATATVTDVLAGAAVDVQGSVTFSCTRPKGNPRFPTSFWIGVSGTNGTRTLASGANTLIYQLYTDYATCGSPWQGATGLTVPNALTANTDLAVNNLSATFCMRIPAAQTTARPLTYTGTATLSVYSTDNTGFLWGSGTLTLTATVNSLCRFTAATPLSFAYTSFQAAPQPGTAGSLDLECTNSTPFNLSLDSTTGTALGLTYELGLNAVGVGTLNSQTGTGATQIYSVPGSIAAGQAGTCATGATCTTTDSRTVTVTY